MSTNDDIDYGPLAFEIDVLRCECGARRRVVGWVLERGVAVRILRHLGWTWEAPVMEPSRAPPVLEFGAWSRVGGGERAALGSRAAGEVRVPERRTR